MMRGRCRANAGVDWPAASLESEWRQVKHEQMNQTEEGMQRESLFVMTKNTDSTCIALKTISY
jgi:hypothetical protein